MSTSQLTHESQALLDDAAARGVGSGFQYVIFTPDTLLFNGVSGYSTMPTEADPAGGTPFSRDDACQLASCVKICICMAVLHVLERGLTTQGCTLADLDNPDALCAVVPEFSGHLVSKVLEGFERDGESGVVRRMKLRDAGNRVTLRMLFTHTAGGAYPFNDANTAELYAHSDGSAPLKNTPLLSGELSDIDIPNTSEPGTAWVYGHATDWLAQFAIRSTGKNLRSLLREIVLDPLGISSHEADTYDGADLADAIVPVYARKPDPDPRNRLSWFEQTALPIYSTAGDAPKGKASYAGGSMYASAQSYAKVLQAVLRRDERILYASTWDLAYADGIEPLGVPMETGLAWKSVLPAFSHDVAPRFVKTAVPGSRETMNLLNCGLETAPTLSGRPAGSFGWAGLTNCYFFLDPINNIGALLTTQLLPFFDPQVIELRDRLEQLIYDNIEHLNA